MLGKVGLAVTCHPRFLMLPGSGDGGGCRMGGGGEVTRFDNELEPHTWPRSRDEGRACAGLESLAREHRRRTRRVLIAGHAAEHRCRAT